MPITIQLNSEKLHTDEELVISGRVVESHQEHPIIIVVVAPNQRPVIVEQINPDSRCGYSFSTRLSEQKFQNSGLYKVTATIEQDIVEAEFIFESATNPNPPQSGITKEIMEMLLATYQPYESKLRAKINQGRKAFNQLVSQKMKDMGSEFRQDELNVSLDTLNRIPSMLDSVNLLVELRLALKAEVPNNDQKELLEKFKEELKPGGLLYSILFHFDDDFNIRPADAIIEMQGVRI